MLTLAQVMDQSQLDQTSAMINELFDGKTAEAIVQIPHLTDLAQDIAKLVAETMDRADAFWTGDVYRDGITNVLSMPEFASSENARSALRLLEERSFLEEVLSNVLSPNVDEVQVVIGGTVIGKISRIVLWSWLAMVHPDMPLERWGFSAQLGWHTVERSQPCATSPGC
jgi:heat-inducible transcriptional repressor